MMMVYRSNRAAFQRLALRYVVMTAVAFAFFFVCDWVGSNRTKLVIALFGMAAITVILFVKRGRFRASYVLAIALMFGTFCNYSRLAAGMPSFWFDLSAGMMLLLFVVAGLMFIFWSPYEDSLAEMRRNQSVADNFEDT